MRKPIRPRVGTRNSSRTQPVPWLTMFSMRPLRRASSWVTTPRKSSGTSIESRSIGSCTTPSTSRVTTCGLPTVSSKPSRRIASTSTASWSSPRPWTSQVSRRSVSSTRIGHVADELLLEPVAHLARGQLRAGLAGERRVVDPDRHAERGLLDRDHRQRPRVRRVGDRLADRDLGDSGEGDDLARRRPRRPRAARRPSVT